VQEGPEGTLLYPIGGNLSNCDRGLRVFYCTQQGETYDKARRMISVRYTKGSVRMAKRRFL
jgi:hypothetical protein